jgi:ATPase family associated with various cellular activities (AAA)
MEDQEQIQRECLLAALKYFEPHSLRSDHPILMELQLDQEEQANYTHKFFVMIQDRGAIVYRMGAGQYAVSENIIPDDPAREKELQRPFDLIIRGIPDDLPETVAALCRSRLHNAVTELLSKTRLKAVSIMIETASSQLDMHAGSPLETEHPGQTRPSDDPPIEVRALQYKAQQPLFTFDQLVVSDALMEDLLSAVEVMRVEHKVFDEWGLRTIQPFPHSALNFHGPPGTGKTLAAHAIAHTLKRSILVASYAEIESKFHGEGPKNVKAIFHAAERDRAILFIDEADSLLSKRLTEVTQGSEQAINSMRSQLFICLQEFRGVVIFATNLVENYDKAFETRVRYLHFPLPDEYCRREIWRRHLVPQLPVAENVSIDQLAAYAEDICGRDIRNAVIDAAVRVARYGKAQVELRDLIEAVDRIKAARIAAKSHEDRS